MPEYKFYTIKKDGHVGGPPAHRNLPDDSAALLEAKKLINGLDIEIWQGNRVVAYVVPDGK
jgi:hypothetical protein